MLKLQFKDQDRDPVWVIDKLFSIGSDSNNHLVLEDAGVDPQHARLINTGDKCFLKDSNSRTGSFVNGLRVTQRELLVGDRIRFGSVELEVVSPQAGGNRTNTEESWRLVADGSWLAGQSFVIPTDRSAIIGRANQCDIVIPGTHLSRRHAELAVLGGSLRIKDLGSANGTYLNEQPITDTLAHSGDQLRIDVYRFRILGPDQDPARTRLRPALAPQAPLAPISGAPLVPAAARKPQEPTPPRRWKTRPTSPGNREEPTYRDSTGGHLWWLILIGVAIALVASLYLL